MMDLPPDPVPFIINVEQHVDETIPIKCGAITQHVSAAEAKRFADALDRFLEVPENLARIAPDLHRFLLGVRRLNFDTQFQAVQNGRWTLACDAPGQFMWGMQPLATEKFTAFLAFDENEDRWFIRDLRWTRMRR